MNCSGFDFNRWRLWMMALLSLHVVALVGCGGAVAPMQDPETIVRERAQAYMSALEQDDYKAAYEYLSPGYRSRVPYEGYAARYVGSMDWLSGEVCSVTCEEEACKVEVRQGFKMLRVPYPGLEAFKDEEDEQFITQPWVYVEDQWWFRPRR